MRHPLPAQGRDSRFAPNQVETYRQAIGSAIAWWNNPARVSAGSLAESIRQNLVPHRRNVWRALFRRTSTRILAVEESRSNYILAHTSSRYSRGVEPAVTRDGPLARNNLRSALLGVFWGMLRLVPNP